MYFVIELIHARNINNYEARRTKNNTCNQYPQNGIKLVVNDYIGVIFMFLVNLLTIAQFIQQCELKIITIFL